MTFTENNKNDLIYMTSPNIVATHAFTTRFGGISSGVFSSLNLGLNLNDTKENVKENYKRLCDVLGIKSDDIVFSNQVHGSRVRVVSQADRGAVFKACTTEQADGVITNERNVALMVFTADCVPMLLHDPVKNVIGAIHAGWRSTAAGIAGIAVQEMQEQFNCNPGNILAAIGPSISGCCYEVGPEVADAFCKFKEYITEHNGKYKVDLKEVNRIQLANAGVVNITTSDECTCCNNKKFWSHRFTKGERGSQIAIISM